MVNGEWRRANGEWRVASGDWHRITTLTCLYFPPLLLSSIPSSLHPPFLPTSRLHSFLPTSHDATPDTFFTGVAYLIVMSNMIGPFIAHGSNGTDALATTTQESAIIACVGVAVLPLCLMRSIDKLGFASILGIVAMFFTSGVVVYYGITMPLSEPDLGTTKMFNFQVRRLQRRCPPIFKLRGAGEHCWTWNDAARVWSSSLATCVMPGKTISPHSHIDSSFGIFPSNHPHIVRSASSLPLPPLSPDPL